MSDSRKKVQFERLLRLAEQLIEQSRQQLRLLRKRMQATHERIDRWNLEMQSMRGPASDATNVSSLQSWRSCSLYVARLGDLVRSEQQSLGEIEQQYQQARGVYMQRRRHLKSLEVLLEKQETRCRPGFLSSGCL